jgi:hypothetical protein
MKRKFLDNIVTIGVILRACIAAGCIVWMGNYDSRAQPAPVDLPKGVQDVVKLSRAGMTEEVILAQIKRAGASYSLTADQLIYLSNQGVSQNVIKALLPASSAAPTVNGSPTPLPVAPPPGDAGPTGIYAPTPLMRANVTSPQVPPPATVSFDYFHDQLAPYGAWMEIAGYGRCWRPTVSATDPFWRPYCEQGHWIYTDGGWFWQSDFPWGEIAFHYGRWFQDSAGWVWAPGYDWAPAWVCWRHAGEYCGWAPLPPAAVFRAGVGLEFGGRLALDVDFGLGPGAFVFVPYDHFWDHNLRGFILPRERAEFVFRRSVVTNGYRTDHGRFVIEGVGRERIAGYTHREVRVEAPIIHDARIQRHMEFERRGLREREMR